MEQDRQYEEVECWIANQNPFALLLWSAILFLECLFLFIPLEIYFWLKFKRWRWR